jgi:hypothetical protein
MVGNRSLKALIAKANKKKSKQAQRRSETRTWRIYGRGHLCLHRWGTWKRGHLMTKVLDDDLEEDKIKHPYTHQGCPEGYVWISTSGFEPRFTCFEFADVPEFYPENY